MRAGVKPTIIGITENGLGSNKILIEISKKMLVVPRVTSFSPDIAARGQKTTRTTAEATAINSSITKTSLRKMTKIIEKTAKKDTRKSMKKVVASRVSDTLVSSCWQL